MGFLTNFLELFKYDPSTDGNSTFNIKTALNENWDKIDAGTKNINDALSTHQSSSEIHLNEENVRDVVSTLLQSGSNIEIFVDDAGDKITIALDRSITSGVSVPSGGSDGDIYLQYE